MLEASGEPIATNSASLYEAINLIGRYAGYRRALWFAQQVLASRLNILWPNAEDEADAILIAGKLIGHEVGFVDCYLFALMRRRNIQPALTFDRYFRYAGFATFTEID